MHADGQIDGVGIQPDFRRDIVGVMTRRAIGTARERIAGSRKEANG